MTNLEEKKSKVIFSEICQGFSKVYYEEELYIKHFGDFDLGQFESDFFYFFEKARSEGLPTFQERLDTLIKEGDWSKQKEIELEDKKKRLNRLEEIRKDLFIKSQIENSKKEIEELKKDISKIEDDKKDLIGIYAESFAQNKMDYIYVLNSFYQDKDLLNKKFDLKKDDIDNNIYYKYIKIHNSVVEKFSLKDIKNIAISEFFQNLMNMSEQNAYFLYGRPVFSTTYYQSSIFSYGKFFSNVLSIPESRKLDDKTKKDPDKLIEWYTAFSSFKTKHKNTNSNAAMSFVVGAQQEDLDYLKQENKGSDLNSLAQSKGGKLSMADLVNFYKK